MNSTGDEKLNLEEFKKFLKATAQDDKELREAFNAFDNDGSGFISKDELKQVMKATGANLSEKEIDEMIQAADFDGDNQVSFEGIKFR